MIMGRPVGKLVVFIALNLIVVAGLSQDRFSEERRSMVRNQLQNRRIQDKEVLKGMMDVKRHRFVPDQYIGRAYDDGPLPIGHGQTISQPYIVAYMTEIIDPRPEFKVLEVGTGSGYQAAVLAKIVAHVYTIEIIQELGQAAEKRLATFGYKNVEIKIADGYYGWEEHAPFDAIVVTAASETIPPPLIQQLKIGGKMIIPVGSPFLTQYLILVEKNEDKISTRNVMPVRFVPFTRSDKDK